MARGTPVPHFQPPLGHHTGRSGTPPDPYELDPLPRQGKIAPHHAIDKHHYKGMGALQANPNSTVVVADDGHIIAILEPGQSLEDYLRENGMSVSG